MQKNNAGPRDGDRMRVRVGVLSGAEGFVSNTRRRGRLTLIELRQDNGHKMWLPRHHLEFTSSDPERVVDRLS